MPSSSKLPAVVNAKSKIFLSNWPSLNTSIDVSNKTNIDGNVARQKGNYAIKIILIMFETNKMNLLKRKRSSEMLLKRWNPVFLEQFTVLLTTGNRGKGFQWFS